ncbi:MAG: HPr family phosphocarrier protein [Pseudobdellovibrionaceae bacterium]
MEINLTILNEEGMHARPAGIFAKKAGEFKSQIEIKFGDKVKNGKSIMSIMGMGLKKGSQITLIAKGEDESQAIAALQELVNSQFQVEA